MPMGLYFGKNFQTKWWGFGYSFTAKEYKIVLFANLWSEEASDGKKDIVLDATYTFGSKSWREIPHRRGHVDCN